MREEQEVLVSVVVPIYNVEAYLRPCLDSLMGQTYEKLELLLIDDGSTDQSGAICDDYARRDSRVKVIHKGNSGVSAARNTGIEIASGKYLIFVDADDGVHPQLVELYMAHRRSGGTLLCDLTLDQEEQKREYATAEMVHTETVKRGSFMELFFRDYINAPFNKFYVTDILKKYEVRFPDGKSLGEDLPFNLEYFRHAPEDFCILHAPLYYYRENRDGSLSTSYRTDLFEIQQESFTELKRFLEDMDVWDEKNRKIYYGMYWDRLYLTAELCRTYEKLHKRMIHPRDLRLKEILRSPLWGQIWKECERSNAANWKRRIKAVRQKVWELLS